MDQLAHRAAGVATTGSGPGFIPVTRHERVTHRSPEAGQRGGRGTAHFFGLVLLMPPPVFGLVPSPGPGLGSVAVDPAEAPVM